MDNDSAANLVRRLLSEMEVIWDSVVLIKDTSTCKEPRLKAEERGDGMQRRDTRWNQTQPLILIDMLISHLKSYLSKWSRITHSMTWYVYRTVLFINLYQESGQYNIEVATQYKQYYTSSTELKAIEIRKNKEEMKKRSLIRK